MKSFKIVIPKEKLLSIANAANRQVAIETGTNRNTHRIHKNKKAYNRQQAKKILW